MLANQEFRSRYSAAELQRPALRFTYNLWLPRSNWYEPFKVAMDLVGSSLLLILTSPLLLAGALLVKLTSQGPAFYTQTRLGRHGKLFTIYKLRSMCHNCEKTSGVQWSTKGDARVTTVGRFLRASKIDELPQLWNVVMGDMSLIGPRPERPEFLQQLEEALPFYRCRLMVRPGLTGLAQVQLPPDTDLSSVRRKLAHDLHYVREHAFLMDLQVFAATFGYIAKVPVALMRMALQLPGGAGLEHDYEFQVISQSNPLATPVRNFIPTKSFPEFRLQVAAAS
jgi:lipopolysaccharide/colanic/teichoic acid biosynthesis glycosyltransferase